jgi:hypothetical protein
VSWHDLDLSLLFSHIRETEPRAEAEKMIWAFDRALEVARTDGQLLEHLLVATSCLIARKQDCTPRDVFDQYFRRSLSDERWRTHYAALLA